QLWILVTVNHVNHWLQPLEQFVRPSSHVAVLPPAYDHPFTLRIWSITHNLLLSTHQNPAVNPSLRGSLPPNNTPVSASRRIICPSPNMPRSRPLTGRTLCPSAANRFIVSAGIPSSSANTESPVPSSRQNRGRLSVSCGFKSSSIMALITWKCPCGCINPPITPKLHHNSPSFNAIPGIIV